METEASSPSPVALADPAPVLILWPRRDAELARLAVEKARLEDKLALVDQSIRQVKFALGLAVGQRVWTRRARQCLTVLGVEPSDLNTTGVAVRVRDGEGEALVDLADLDCG